MRNFEFYGAPTALFCFIDRTMGAPQWSDLGMFLQTFMLISEEAGLGAGRFGQKNLNVSLIFSMYLKIWYYFVVWQLVIEI